MKIGLGALIALLCCAVTPVLAAETGYTLRSTDLKLRPFLDAETLQALPVNTRVDILQRQGAWMRVNSLKQQGWVRMLSVRLGSADQGGQEDGGWLSVFALGKPRSSSPTTATVTTGVRGFSEEELKASTPSPAEFDKLASFAATPDQAAALAAAGALATRQVPYYADNGKPERSAK